MRQPTAISNFTLAYLEKIRKTCQAESAKNSYSLEFPGARFSARFPPFAGSVRKAVVRFRKVAMQPHTTHGGFL